MKRTECHLPPTSGVGTCTKNTLANHRHERHHRHCGDKTPYLCLFLYDANHDDEVTVINRAVRDRHAIIPYLKAYDAHDGDDDEMQRFSEGGAWEESFEAVPTTTASVIGKREVPGHRYLVGALAGMYGSP